LGRIGILACLVTALFLTAGGALAQPWQPPRILAEFTALPERPWNDNEEFGHEFCCPGDVNSDGFPDLLIYHDTNARGISVPYFYLYMGGDTISNIPIMTFGPDSIADEFRDVVVKLYPIGNLIPNMNLTFGYGRRLIGQGRNRATDLQLFECGEEIDTISDVHWLSVNRQGPSLGESGINMRPGDYNGDGFVDLLTVSQVDTNAIYLIFYGGNDFDTIPDWQTTLVGNDQIPPANFIASSGCDVNSDGCDDILMRVLEWASPDSVPWRTDYFYYMFLGGVPMDTLPLFRIRDDYFQEDWGNRWIGNPSQYGGFSLIDDVNNDGFDDWTFYWQDRIGPNDDNGTYIFFGSAHPDMEPDMNLEGTRRFGPGFGYPIGGDFNGDGYSDILVVYHSMGGTDLHYHFGSRWIRNDPDYVVYPYRDMGDIYDSYLRAGAVADYNNDGADYAVMYTATDSMHNDTIRYPERLIILGGDRRWRINEVNEGQPESFELILKAYPNPFNNTTRISFVAPKPGNYMVEVFDLSGRLVADLSDRRERLSYGAGEHSFTWQASTAGVYLVAVTSDQGVKAVRKVVCLP